jgi:hypothetical protein
METTLLPAMATRSEPWEGYAFRVIVSALRETYWYG